MPTRHLMGWRERDWARFTNAEREALYGGRTTDARPLTYYTPPSGGRGRSLLAPGAGLAIVVSVGALLLGQFPRQHPLLPALHIGSPSALAPASLHRTFPLNLQPTASYGSVLTVNGTDPNATTGAVVATGQWNGGPWTALASGTLASDHSWSIPIAMNQHGTLNLRIALPSGDSLAGNLTVQP